MRRRDIGSEPGQHVGRRFGRERLDPCFVERADVVAHVGMRRLGDGQRWRAGAEQHRLGPDEVGGDRLDVPAGQARRSRPVLVVEAGEQLVEACPDVVQRSDGGLLAGRWWARQPPSGRRVLDRPPVASRRGTGGTCRRSATDRPAASVAGSRRDGGTATTTARAPTARAPRRRAAGRRRPARRGTARPGRTASGRRTHRAATTRSWSARTSSFVVGSAIASATTDGSMPISASSSSATSRTCGWRPSSCSARPARSYQASTSTSSRRFSSAAIRSIDQPYDHSRSHGCFLPSTRLISSRLKKRHRTSTPCQVTHLSHPARRLVRPRAHHVEVEVHVLDPHDAIVAGRAGPVVIGRRELSSDRDR